MTYTPNVPVSGQTLGNSRTTINANFQRINTVWAVNHFNIKNANAGKHEFVSMPAGGNQTTAAGEGAIYTKTVSGVTHLFYRYASNGTVIQISNDQLSVAASGVIPLMGGMIMQWGTGSTGSTTNFTVTFKSGGVNTNPYSINITPTNLGTVTGWRVTSVQPNSFSVTSTNASFNYYWIAIGPFN